MEWEVWRDGDDLKRIINVSLKWQLEKVSLPWEKSLEDWRTWTVSPPRPRCRPPSASSPQPRPVSFQSPLSSSSSPPAADRQRQAWSGLYFYIRFLTAEAAGHCWTCNPLKLFINKTCRKGDVPVLWKKNNNHTDFFCFCTFFCLCLL